MHTNILAHHNISIRRTLVAALCAALLIAPSAAAQSSGSGQALEIGPPVINLTGKPGDSMKASINLRDISPTPLVVSNEINDFSSKDESGTPSIILEDIENPYSIKDWITAIPEFTLNAKELRTIDITITIPRNAEPGGYYGVIRFSGSPPELEGTGVSLSASIGSLLFITVEGQAKEALSIEEFYMSKSKEGSSASFFEEAPISFIERIKNSGNTYEQPSGLVTIKDMFGNVVATLGVNQPIRTILPDSIRKFDQPLDKTVIGDKMLFGYYTAHLDVTYGSNKTIVSTDSSFWVIPYRLIFLWIGLGVVAIVGLRVLIKRYNRAIIQRAQGSSPARSKGPSNHRRGR